MLKKYSHFIGEKTEAKRGDLPSHTAKCGFNPLPFELQSLTFPHLTPYTLQCCYGYLFSNAVL